MNNYNFCYTKCSNELLERFKIKTTFYLAFIKYERCECIQMTLLGLSIGHSDSSLRLEFSDDEYIDVDNSVLQKDFFNDNDGQRIYFSEKKCKEYLCTIMDERINESQINLNNLIAKKDSFVC